MKNVSPYNDALAKSDPKPASGLRLKRWLALLLVTLGVGITANAQNVLPILNGSFTSDQLPGVNGSWAALGTPNSTSGWNGSSSLYALNLDRFGLWTVFLSMYWPNYDLNYSLTGPSIVAVSFQAGYADQGGTSVTARLTVGGTPISQTFTIGQALGAYVAAFTNTTATGDMVLGFTGGGNFLTGVSSVYLFGAADKPIITQPPAGFTVLTPGANLNLSVTAVGIPPLTYQWQTNGVPLSGQTNAALAISGTTPASSGNYTAVVTGGNSLSVTSSVAQVGQAYVPQWQRTELAFTGTGTYANPVTQVNLMVTFTGPSNQVYNVPGFWDGGNTWRVRFAPPTPGTWMFTNSCNVADAGLARNGSLLVSAPTGTNALYLHGGFLHNSADNHYLTYADGTPFFWLGDTCWFCPGNLAPMNGGTSAQYVTDSMFKQWVNQRKSQNFDIMHMAFIGTLDVNNSSPQTQMSSGTIDPAYWQQVDRYMNYANDAGVVPAVILDTWNYDLPNFTTNQLLFVWRYFVARYGAHAVTFLIAGEYNADQNNLTNDLVKVNAIGTLIKQIDPYQRVFTVHPAGYAQGDRRQQWGWPWYGFIMFQGEHFGHGQVPATAIYTAGWNDNKPVIEGEANYEGLYGGSANMVLPSDVRGTAYHAIQAGAAGYTYGVAGLWYPTQSTNDNTFWSTFGTSLPWWQALDFQGATNLTYLRRFYESIPWWKLQPRPGAVSIQGGPLPDATQPLAKSDGDSQYVVWFPLGSGRTAATTLRLNATNVSGTFTGSWFNPGNGQNTAIGAPLPATNGVCSLPSRPDTNDWVLLLNAVSNAAPTGLSATSGSRMAVLQWNSVLGATNYLVKRGVNPGGPYTNFNSLGAASYTDTNLVNGTTYYYVVSAFSAAGESPKSGEVSVVPTPTVSIGNPSFELTVTNAYSVSGWNTLPQPGDWSGGGSPFDTLNPTMGGHFASVPAGTNCCYLVYPGTISQDLQVVVNAGDRVNLAFAQGRASSSLGTNSSSVTVIILVGGQSWSTNFSDAALAQGSWRTNIFSIVPSMAGKLRISFTNTSGNSFVDDVRLTVLPLPPRPKLSGALTGNSLTLSWGLEAEGFHLYGASNLVPTVEWIQETVSLQTNMQGITATLPIGPDYRFFRLISP